MWKEIKGYFDTYEEALDAYRKEFNIRKEKYDIAI